MGPGGIAPPPEIPVMRIGGRFRDRRRLAGAWVMAVAIALVLVALVLPWWSVTITVGSNTWTGYLFPGTALDTCSGNCANLYSTCGGLQQCWGASQNTGYIWDNDLTNANALYGGILVLLVLAVVSGFLAVLLGFQNAYIEMPTRRRRWTFLLSSVVATIFVFVAVVAVVALQPGALSSDFSSLMEYNLWMCGPGASPTNSFWGSNSGSCTGGALLSGVPVQYSWGAWVGWYVALVALLLLVFDLLLFVRVGFGPRLRKVSPR